MKKKSLGVKTLVHLESVASKSTVNYSNLSSKICKLNKL